MKQEERHNSFLGRGWSFPPRFIKPVVGPAMIEMSEAAQDINESLEILFSTRLGERVMLPGYGCDLSSVIFEGLSTSIVTFLKDMILTAIKRYEPRITVERIDIRTGDEGAGKIIIEIDYLIRITNTRTNFVYPFYINEATNL